MAGMSRLSDLHLVLFFTRGLSLATWDRVGMLEREVALYRALRPHLGRITFITYGDAGDLAYGERLPGIDIVCNRWRLPHHWYLRWLHHFPGSWRRGPAVYKSNQTQGAEIALSMARRWRHPFISRCGYLYGFTMRRVYGADSSQAQMAATLERSVFSGANRLIVTTEVIKRSIMEEYNIDGDYIHVVPNYVQTERFCPVSNRPPDTGNGNPSYTLFIGRLESEKNLFVLLEAMVGLPGELWLVGEGSLRGELETRAAQLGVRARFLGRRSHNDLPDLINGSTLFVLPSLYEGHPKTLLEAMSCGVAVVGTDVVGIREVIDHQRTGLLCQPEVMDLHQTLHTLLRDADLRNRLGANARAHILGQVALERVVEQELSVLKKLLV